MRTYLSARWSRREEVLEVQKQIEELGIESVSQWLTQDLQSKPEQAHMDMADVKRCSHFVRFADDTSTETVPSTWMSAARFVEMGFALAWGKKSVVVAAQDIRPIFDFLPQVKHVCCRGAACISEI
jgi:hypothetical protein